MDEMTMYVSADEIQNQIINMSKKQIRKFVRRYLPVKKTGKRLYVNRAEPEKLLSNPKSEFFPLDFEC